MGIKQSQFFWFLEIKFLEICLNNLKLSIAVPLSRQIADKEQKLFFIPSAYDNLRKTLD